MLRTKRTVPWRLLCALMVSSALAGLGSRALAQDSSDCRAVVSVSDRLGLARRDGSLVGWFAGDAVDEHAVVSLSPSAQRALYVPVSDPKTFMLADVSGASASFDVDGLWKAGNPEEDEYRGAAFMGVTWAGRSGLRLERHISPSTSRFDFYGVALGEGRLPRLRWQSRAFGEQCVRSDRSGRVACLWGNAVEVDGEPVYSESPFDGVAPLEVLTLRVGTPASARVARSFQVLVSSLDGGITLRVTLPTGAWTQTHIERDGYDAESDGEDEYAFFPTIIDRQRQLVRVAIVKARSLELSALAWMPNARGEDGLLVARTIDGHQTLLLLQPASERGHARSRSRWVKASEAAVGLSDAIESLQLEAGSRVAYRTYQAFGALVVSVAEPAAAGGRASLTVTSVEKRPPKVCVGAPGGTVEAEVLDWVCR